MSPESVTVQALNDSGLDHEVTNAATPLGRQVHIGNSLNRLDVMVRGDSSGATDLQCRLYAGKTVAVLDRTGRGLLLRNLVISVPRRSARALNVAGVARRERPLRRLLIATRSAMARSNAVCQNRLSTSSRSPTISTTSAPAPSLKSSSPVRAEVAPSEVLKPRKS